MCLTHADSNSITLFVTGLCYGKLEAGILTFIIPSILLGHLVSTGYCLYLFQCLRLNLRPLVHNWKPSTFTLEVCIITATILAKLLGT